MDSLQFRIQKESLTGKRRLLEVKEDLGKPVACLCSARRDTHEVLCSSQWISEYGGRGKCGQVGRILAKQVISSF